MNRITKIFFAILIVCSSVVLPAVAQTRQQLEAQKRKAQENLAQTNKLLNETQKSKQGSENKIGLLRRNISQREALIRTLNGEIGKLEQNIEQLGVEKAELEQRLNLEKDEYANVVRQTYARRNFFSPLLFILSSETFSQAFRRFRYLQEIARYRRQQALDIQRLTDDLSVKETLLQSDLQQKGRAVTEKERETRKLSTDCERENQMLDGLKKREKDLKAQQKAQQKKRDELNAKIQKLIAEEIRKEEEKRKKNAAKKGTPVTQMSKEEQVLAGSFEKNKGRLPLPVQGGFVSGHFGVQPHPVLKHVTTNNKGVYIQGPAGSAACAVFDGVVSKVFLVPGSNSTVIVKHGNYRTVYSNLTALYVKEGDKVSARQKIGKIFIDTENDNKTEMCLMLYQNIELLNPEPWLAK